MTPLASSSAHTRIGGGHGGHQSFMQQDPRKARYSRLFSPAQRASSDVMSTPIAMNSGSKFRGSPMAVQGSWKPKHPTVVALQRRSLVWSPLKLKAMRVSSRIPTSTVAPSLSSSFE
ncbi:hypothetical protein MLD38_020673 [Melastoma candidum]|nr:hypothetical protein MLD38_020673 [Melastoma candidum]